MTLRTRIAAVAGLAVAVAVLIAVAVAVYVAVRGAAARQVDDALRSARRTSRRSPTATDRGAGRATARLVPAPRRSRRRRFGGARGLRPDRLPDGTVAAPPGGAATRCPLAARARAIARARLRRGAAPTRRSHGIHLRVLTRACRRRRGAVQVARPLDEVDRQLAASCSCSLSSPRPASRSRAGLGALVARAALAPIAALHAPHRGDRRRPGPVERMEVDGRRRAGPARAQLQRDARRARALGRGAAPPRRRRQPRAAHADRQPAREHPDARGRRPPARARARGAAGGHRRGARRADGAGRPTSSSWRAAASRTSVLDDVRARPDRRRAVASAPRARGGRRRQLPRRPRADGRPRRAGADPAARSRTCSTTRSSGARPAAPSSSALRDGDADRARPRSRASRTPTCRTSSSASTAPTARAACPGSGLGLAIVRQAAEAHGGCARPRTRPAAAR